MKSVLFRLNYGLGVDDKIHLGGGRLLNNYPDAVAQEFTRDAFMDRLLLVYRDPIARIKSAYRGIFIHRQQMSGTLSEFFDGYFADYLEAMPTNNVFNHYKPMSWFFPNDIIDDERLVAIKTESLSGFPERLGLKLDDIPTKHASMPHYFNTKGKMGDIDMTDPEIRQALGSLFDKDFELFEKYEK